MKSVMQSNDGMYGNCLAACIASVLEVPLETVPSPAPEDFADDEAWMRYLGALKRWLWRRNLGLIYGVSTDGILPDGYSIVGVRVSESSEMTHSVIFLNGELVHDPHPVHKGRYTRIVDFFVLYLLDPARGVCNQST